MSTDNLTGLIPVVVMGGVAMKMADNMLSKPNKKNKKKSNGKRKTVTGQQKLINPLM